MSGAGNIKGDASSETTLVEIKDAIKSFTLTSKLLRRHYQDAVVQHKEPQLLILFHDGGFIVEATIRLNTEGIGK